MRRADNAYFVIPPRGADVIPWNPVDENDLPVPDCAYLGRVLAALERDSGIRDLTFFITSNLDALPSYGPAVVAIVLGDEWCRIPRYVFRVRATFKTYGTSLAVHRRALLHPSLYELAALAQDLRTLVRGIPYAAAFVRSYLRELLHRRRPAWRVYDLPLGYFRQTEVPFVPIGERRFDVYFAGSVTNRSMSARRLQQFTPKSLSRAQMLERLNGMAKRYPYLSITTALTASFMQTSDDDAARYSQTMMQTKICLVPRGTSLETYRYFEGLRFGCVVIAERLPRRWFYDAAPALRVRRWSELERLIPELLADPKRLESLSRASLDWWSGRCSGEAVGAYIVRKLEDRSRSTTTPLDPAQA
jgi:hypothetical protein